jgi:hypothetical protein
MITTKSHQPSHKSLNPKPAGKQRDQRDPRVRHHTIIIKDDPHTIQSDPLVILHHTSDLLIPGRGGPQPPLPSPIQEVIQRPPPDNTGGSRLMRRYGLGSYDAVHAATALKEGIPDIATLDQGFAALPPSAAHIHTTSRRLPQMRSVRGGPPTPPNA